MIWCLDYHTLKLVFLRPFGKENEIDKIEMLLRNQTADLNELEANEKSFQSALGVLQSNFSILEDQFQSNEKVTKNDLQEWKSKFIPTLRKFRNESLTFV